MIKKTAPAPSGTIHLGPLDTAHEPPSKACTEFENFAILSQALKRATSSHAFAVGAIFSDMEWECLEDCFRQIASIINHPGDSAQCWENLSTVASLMVEFKRNMP